jgi:hypothetical protein
MLRNWGLVMNLVVFRVGPVGCVEFLVMSYFLGLKERL